MYELHMRQTGNVVTQEYFGIVEKDLKYVESSGKCSDKARIMEPNVIALRLLGDLARTAILKSAFYSAAQNVGIKADHIEGWCYRASDNGDILVDLWQHNARGADSYLCFPMNQKINQKQKAFLLCFVKTLEEILKK
jgi:hypothetical protein